MLGEGWWRRWCRCQNRRLEGHPGAGHMGFISHGEVLACAGRSVGTVGCVDSGSSIFRFFPQRSKTGISPTPTGGGELVEEVLDLPSLG